MKNEKSFLNYDEFTKEHLIRCPACYARYTIYKKTGKYLTDEMMASERGVVDRICDETNKHLLRIGKIYKGYIR